jgi:hypothetical protein
MPPVQDVSSTRRFLFQSVIDESLYLDFGDPDDKGNRHVILRPEVKPADPGYPTRQVFRVWIHGQIQSVSEQGEDLNGGYLTRRHEQGGRVIIVLEQYRGNDQNQVWNFLPGRWRPQHGPGDNEMYTGIVTPHRQDEIVQAVGNNQEVEVVKWAPYDDPWTPTKGNQMPQNQSWNCPEV